MRGSRSLLTIVMLAGLIAGLSPTTGPAGAATGLPSTPVAPDAQPAVDALRAQRAVLLDRLGALIVAGSQPTDALAAEGAVAGSGDRLVADSGAIADVDSRLRDLQTQIADNERGVAAIREQLTALLHGAYETGSSEDGFAAVVLGASSISDAVDRVQQTHDVVQRIQDLESEMRRRGDSLAVERSALAAAQAAATDIEHRLTQDDGALLASIAQRDAALAGLTPEERALAGQIVDLDQRVTATRPVDGGASCGDRFAYGQCTYYVASRRCVPWFGDAWQWYGAAARMGFAEGHVPRPGAVAVWGSGQGAASGAGHVALVETVGPAPGVPAGSFKISEMNWGGGWGTVSYRVLPDSAPYLLGFIYGKG